MQNMEKNGDGLQKSVDVMKSTYLELDKGASTQNSVIQEFPGWIASIKNIDLATRARELWRYLKDDSISNLDKAVIVAALVYCISPIDLVPDYIPLAGLLDDLSVVLRVLAGIAVDAKVNNRRL